MDSSTSRRVWPGSGACPHGRVAFGRFVAAAVWVALGVIAPLGAGCDGKPGPARGGAMPPASAAWAAPLAVGPVTFFESRCANCHGTLGKDYDPASPTHNDQAALVAKIREMVLAHGREDAAKFQPQDYAAQRTLHDALMDRSPFVAITAHAWPSVGDIRGQAAGVQELELIIGPLRARAFVDDFQFVFPASTLAEIRQQVSEEEWLNAELVGIGPTQLRTRVLLRFGAFTGAR
jgi:hypothetical protein